MKNVTKLSLDLSALEDDASALNNDFEHQTTYQLPEEQGTASPKLNFRYEVCDYLKKIIHNSPRAKGIVCSSGEKIYSRTLRCPVIMPALTKTPGIMLYFFSALLK